MEATYIVDCGHHTIKYAGLSKHHKRTVEVLVKERRSECNAYVADDERLRQSVPQLLSGELRTDEDLTLMLLLDTFTSQKSKASLLYSCFEQFGCKRVCLHYTASTGLYAAGETSGVVVDIGYAGVQLSSVCKGVAQTALSARLSSVGTRSLDCELHKLTRSDVTEEGQQRAAFLHHVVGPRHPSPGVSEALAALPRLHVVAAARRGCADRRRGGGADDGHDAPPVPPHAEGASPEGRHTRARERRHHSFTTECVQEHVHWCWGLRGVRS